MKNSFTLFEILISLIILSIALSSLIKIFTPNENIQTYNELQEIENQYIQNGTVLNSQNIKLHTYQ